MGIEIEVKHLVRDESWRDAATGSARMAQGYVASGDMRTVRVRIADSEAWLTLKFGGGKARGEFEYAIPVEDARALLAHAEGTVIDKTRWYVPFEGHTWEVDEFHGDLAGLVTAELELESEDEDFPLPPWVGDDVTGRPEYLNSSLAANGLPR
ncbi:CYTH domain-containing protein [Demequina pelophila]|uniref:CYTH domain-containing protein n=1 Tax=Demequina pelophila TaxID=1638984 RepID=UPI00078185A6|nr:CYTH domain-containing protein [Demequina pelophila]